MQSRQKHWLWAAVLCSLATVSTTGTAHGTLPTTAQEAGRSPLPTAVVQGPKAEPKDEKPLVGIADLRISPDIPKDFKRPDGVPKGFTAGNGHAKSAPVAFGELEKIEHRSEWGKKVKLTGWAMDGTERPATVRIFNSSSTWRTKADLHRADVDSFGNGTKHGFEVMVPISGKGEQTLCVQFAEHKNATAGEETCATFFALEPLGGMTGLDWTEDDKLTVTGWALDPDTTDPIQVKILDDNKLVTTVTADQPIDDPATREANAAYGPNHQFSAVISASAAAGIHSLQAVAVDAEGSGADTPVGQQYYIAPEDVTGFTATPGSVTATSARFDLNWSSGSLPKVRFEAMEVRQDGTGEWKEHGTVDKPLQYRYTGLRPDTPYRFRMTASNYRSSAPPIIVEQRTAPLAEPFGSLYLEELRDDGKMRLTGWAIDPDDTAPLEVVIRDNGQQLAKVTADDPLPADIAGNFPDHGSAHAFDVLVPASSTAGIRSVTATALRSPELGGDEFNVGQQYYIAPPDATKPVIRMHNEETTSTKIGVEVVGEEGNTSVRFEAAPVENDVVGEWRTYGTENYPNHFTYTGLEPDTTYRLRITAFNYHSESEPIELDWTTARAPLPAVSQLTVIEADDSEITVQWKDNSGGNSSPEEDSFELKVDDFSTGTSKVIKVPASPGTWDVRHRLTELTKLTEYSITVRPVRAYADPTALAFVKGRTSGPAGINSFMVTKSSEQCTRNNVTVSVAVSHAKRIVIRVKTGEDVVWKDIAIPSDKPYVNDFAYQSNVATVKTFTLIAYDEHDRTTTKSLTLSSD